MTKTEFREALRGLGIRQGVLADRLGVTQETVSRWLNGHLELPVYATAYLEALQEQVRLSAVLESIECEAKRGRRT